MHSLGYVHRDIKPQNIFLKQNENGDLTVKLGDFGSAHPLNDDKTTNISGAKGNQGVTVLYSAPEVHQGIPYGRKSDIWSIGRQFDSKISNYYDYFRMYSISYDHWSCSMEQGWCPCSRSKCSHLSNVP